MLKKLSILLILLAMSSKSFASSASLNCAAQPGFACAEKCPAASAGFKLDALDCTCRKDRTSNTCTASGVCVESTLAGVPTGNRVACLCDKYSTIYNDTASKQNGIKIEANVTQ
jgi:hypothetical protein